MRRVLAAFSVALAAALAAGTGCSAGKAEQRAQAPPPAAQKGQAAPQAPVASTMPACPMSVPGTDVAAADTPDGERVTYTTSPEWAPDLRARVREMADLHNRLYQPGQTGAPPGEMPHGEGMTGGGSMGSGGGAGDHMGMMPPPSQASVEDVANGASIVVTPNDPADLDRLRSAMRMQVEHMRESGTCPMESPHM